ncbi:MAG: transporter substrate-binding domain-containing protein [Planctomycetota bacterium]|jgi:polar amino acid transport system substrate-binding protein|nr:transporter substrate-binding domain-containing protein [Planctomycetota bacterium]
MAAACVCLAGAETTHLRVAIKEAPPFVMIDEAGVPQGISIQLWQAIADDNAWTTEWVVTDLAGVLRAAAKAETDLSIAAITATPSREEVMDFSLPYLTTGLGIAVRTDEGSLTRLLRIAFSGPFFAAILSLMGLLVLVGTVLWVFERKHNSDFDERPVRGIGGAVWWAAVTLTTVGYGDKTPKTPLGRTLGLWWMFAGLLVVASFTATIASSMTLDGYTTTIHEPKDLGVATVAVVANTTAAHSTAFHAKTLVLTESLDIALKRLTDGQVSAVVHDRPLLRYARHHEGITVLGASFDEQLYAIAMPEDSPYHELINRSILKLHAEGDIDKILESYFAKD